MSVSAHLPRDVNHTGSENSAARMHEGIYVRSDVQKLIHSRAMVLCSPWYMSQSADKEDPRSITTDQTCSRKPMGLMLHVFGMMTGWDDDRLV
jgi:hypothetical protein